MDAMSPARMFPPQGRGPDPATLSADLMPNPTREYIWTDVPWAPGLRCRAVILGKIDCGCLSRDNGIRSPRAIGGIRLRYKARG